MYWGVKMEDKTKLLTAAEMSSLWAQYMNDSVSICVLSYFMNNIDAQKVKKLLSLLLVLHCPV